MPAGGLTITAYIVIPRHEGEPSMAARSLILMHPFALHKSIEQADTVHSFASFSTMFKNL